MKKENLKKLDGPRKDRWHTEAPYGPYRKSLLTSLKGGLKEVGGDFYCNHNNLTTLKGIGMVKGKIYD
jgi:hypothetical protein